MPVDLGTAQQFAEAQFEAFFNARPHQPAAVGDQGPDEAVKFPVSVEETPIEPPHLVILAICVVIAALSAAHFVAH